MPEQSSQSDEEVVAEFIKLFCAVASLQGRFAYCLMSIYAVNPAIFEYFTSLNLFQFFHWNMIYGITLLIYSRPSLKSILGINRFIMSIFGSLSFNYSSLLWYQWLNVHFEDSPVLRTFLAFLSGRIMMVYLLAFLYHIDTRSTDVNVSERPRRISAFEAMYT